MTSLEMSSPGSAHTRPESGPLKIRCRPFSWPTCARTGSMRTWNCLLQLVLELLNLGLGVLRKALDVDLEALDLLLEVALRGQRSSPSLPSRASPAGPGAACSSRSARPPSWSAAPESSSTRSCPRPIRWRSAAARRRRSSRLPGTGLGAGGGVGRGRRRLGRSGCAGAGFCVAGAAGAGGVWASTAAAIARTVNAAPKTRPLIPRFPFVRQVKLIILLQRFVGADTGGD